ncbi:MAG: hypothetical protein QXU40_00825 [Candidatus Pacearchaeota archaeon]
MENIPNKRKFYTFVKDIKTIKIQGARNIAKAALRAYLLIPTKKSKKILIDSRPTEPMMRKVLDLAEAGASPQKILKHFNEAQMSINKLVLKVIKNGDRIFTHCHSTNVVNALIYAKKQKKSFEVYVTETRPLFQGRKTAKELINAGIKTTLFIDSTFAFVIGKESKKDKIYSTKIFLGADALLKNGIINKVGSRAISEIAYINKVPVYVIADSWKFTKEKVPIEQRDLNEIWDKAPKKIKMKNPAFEFVPKKYIHRIITELGAMEYSNFTNLLSEKSHKPL